MDIEATLARGSQKGPPKDIAPNDLVRRLGDTRRPSEVLPFVRRDDDGNPLFSYRMLVLTVDELDIARANADQYTRGKLGEQLQISDEQANRVRAETWEMIFKDALIVEVLFASMRQSDDASKHIWDAPSQLRRLLTTDELAGLFDAYQSVQFRLGPMWRLLTEEEVDSWIEKLTAGAGYYPFVGLGQGQLVQLATSMAYRLGASKTAIGSSGLPSDDTTSDRPESSPEAHSEA